jgi:hypothetical protein
MDPIEQLDSFHVPGARPPTPAGRQQPTKLIGVVRQVERFESRVRVPRHGRRIETVPDGRARTQRSRSLSPDRLALSIWRTAAAPGIVRAVAEWAASLTRMKKRTVE